MADLLHRLRAALGDRYRIERPLGAGGMAIVYLAEDLKHHRRVAIKVMKSEVATAVGAERFLREVEVAAGLDHPHIVPVHDSGEANGLLYYVMPYVDGESLRERLTREKQLRVEDAVQIAREVADALGYAHSRGVVHRDVKPENILLARGHARVADFGIARAISAVGGERLTQTGTVIGTPAYMSPEQATGRRELDARSDIFSLGAVLYEMLSGEPPYPGATTHAIIARLLTEEPSPLHGVRAPVPPDLESAVMKALAKVPADRFTSAAEFAHAVRLPDVPDRMSRGRRRVAVTAALTVMTIAVVLGAKWLSGRSERRATISDRPPVQITTTGIAEAPVFAPDGKAIAHLEFRYPEIGLVVRDLDGGSATILRGSRGVLCPRWSPSGLRVLCINLWPPSLSVVSRLGGERRDVPLPPGLGIRGADFGIDDSTFVLALRTRGAGQWFYVGRQPWAIREVGPDSLSGPGLLVHLTRATGSVVPVQGRIVGLRVSPDRRWAAYVGIAGRDSGSVFVGAIALDDGRGFVAAEDSGDLAMYEVGTTQPSWSPGNDWIYYARRVGPETTILRVQVAPGSGRRTRGPEIVLDRLPRNLDFDVTPDGRRLVYSAGTRRAAPYLLSWDGRGREAAALVSGTSSYRHSAMGPDGQAVAYVKRPEFELEYGAGDLYVRSLPGGPERLVARRAEAPIGWSPDGKQLAFFTSEGMGLRLVDVETGRVRAVGTRYGLPPSGLSWSPDGRTIVYQSNGAIVVHDTGGRALEIPALRPAALQSRAHPVFSPDGRRLAVLLPEGLGVHDLETGHTSVLSPESLMPLGWTPDGWVYAIPSRRDTIVRLVRVPVTGGPSRVVAQSLNLRDCSDLTLAPRGGAVVCTRVEPATDIWLKDLVPGH